MERREFQYGESILSPVESNKNIIIVWSGLLQVRVQLTNNLTDQTEDYWLGNIGPGSCIDAYNCFNTHKKSIVSYFANSNICQIVYIKLRDLFNLGKSIIELNHSLKVAELKSRGLVDDIDYRTFPKKYLYINRIEISEKKERE